MVLVSKGQGVQRGQLGSNIKQGARSQTVTAGLKASNAASKVRSTVAPINPTSQKQLG